MDTEESNRLMPVKLPALVVLTVLLFCMFIGVGNKMIFATGEGTPENPEVRIVYKKEKIKFKTVKKKSNKVLVGEKKVSQKGVDGVKESRYDEEYVNGEMTKSTFVSSEVIKEPKNKIISIGTKKPRNMRLASRGGYFRFSKQYVMEATAYSPRCTGSSVTKSGMRAAIGRIAVDPRVIPLGTKMYIQGLNGTADYGFCVAADVGSAIKGKRVDLFFNSYHDCVNFGRQKVRVYILE